MIRILIVDDHAILRAGIRALLQLQTGFEVVGEAADGKDALAKTQALSPDIVLMDIGMPGVDGMTAARQIMDARPETRVLILTQHENAEYVMPVLQAGAAGYVLKRAPDDTLIRAIRAVAAGDKYLDARIGHVFAEGNQAEAGDHKTVSIQRLTEREHEVFTLLAQGKTYQEVAQLLCVSVKTVDFHRANLMRKLNLNNRSELVRLALEEGVI